MLYLTGLMSNVLTIPLDRDYSTLVDSDIWERMRYARFNWKAQVHSGKDRVYAYANCGGVMYLHRLITGAKKGEVVDHINGDGLDNRKANLRICTYQQNIQNQRRPKDNTTGYKGLFWAKNSRAWAAQINTGGIRYHLGIHPTAKRAAMAYDRAALALFGEFACLNFPELKDSYKPVMPTPPKKREA